MHELVHLDVAAGVATITLDSPANRNALSTQLRGELIGHLRGAIADDAARVIVLTHTGTVFCAGMDLKETRGASAQAQGIRDVPEILELIWTSPKPVVARLAGAARAGGVGIVAACDIAVATADATFAFSEVRIGVVPAVISVTVLPRLLPRAAHELFLTGETFDATRAVAVGLLNSVVHPTNATAAIPAGSPVQENSAPVSDLDMEVDRYTGMLRLGAPGALAATKEMLRGKDSGMSDRFDEMLTLSAGFFAGDEGQEGMRAFAEKRPPAWAATQ